MVVVLVLPLALFSSTADTGSVGVRVQLYLLFTTSLPDVASNVVYNNPLQAFSQSLYSVRTLPPVVVR